MSTQDSFRREGQSNKLQIRHRTRYHREGRRGGQIKPGWYPNPVKTFSSGDQKAPKSFCSYKSSRRPFPPPTLSPPSQPKVTLLTRSSFCKPCNRQLLTPPFPTCPRIKPLLFGLVDLGFCPQGSPGSARARECLLYTPNPSPSKRRLEKSEWYNSAVVQYCCTVTKKSKRPYGERRDPVLSLIHI